MGGSNTKQGMMKGDQAKVFEYNLPVVEEDIWNPNQVRREAQILHPRVTLLIPRKVNVCPMLKQQSG